MKGSKTQQTTTDDHGTYSFTGLEDGIWTIQVEMTGFSPSRRSLLVSHDRAPAIWSLALLSPDEMKNAFIAQPLTSTFSNPVYSERSLRKELPTQTASTIVPTNGAGKIYIINGSISDGKSAAFGNKYRNELPIYSADLNLTLNNSTFDAKPFSLTGQKTPIPAYNQMEVSLNLSGPIPLRTRRRPLLTLAYSRAQNRNISLLTTRVPTLAERIGNFSNTGSILFDPLTGLPFESKVLPEDRLSPQALNLLNLYPLPNITEEGQYNYQAPIDSAAFQDNLWLQIGGTVQNHRLSGDINLQKSRTENRNLFDFIHHSDNLAKNVNLNWAYRLREHLLLSSHFSLRRTSVETHPYFAGRRNVSGDAGIRNNAQEDPRNWGPPNLNFSGGIAALSDGQYSFDRTQLSKISHDMIWTRYHHTFSAGIGFRRQHVNLFSQQDPRGTLTFTGSVSGNDFADFLLGIPAVSSIAFGNPDKYLRSSGYEAYVKDDWKVHSNLTVNLGFRWDYESPVTEQYDRLVNLDITPGFSTMEPVLGKNPRGPVTGKVYPNSLVRPDKRGFQPRIGLAWHPRASSSLVIRAGYGVYRETDTYLPIAEEMAQQSPLSTNFRMENNPETDFTLADCFTKQPLRTPNTFAVDPDFRIGYVQTWQLSIQHDLPSAFQVNAVYTGVLGHNLPQRILPNSFPPGKSALSSAPPAGYIYLMSKGDLIGHTATINFRRRLRNGFEGGFQYTWGKTIDDSGLDGFHIAQDWQNPQNERAPSNFDRRHQVAVQTTYTTGLTGRMGMKPEAWTESLLSGWTLMTEFRMSSGTPLTPIVVASVRGTGITESLRPNRTGEPLYLNDVRRSVNPAAFSPPPPGEWGNSGRNSITGPTQFTMNAFLGRIFHLGNVTMMELRLEVMNVLNHVTIRSWNTPINSKQFGLPSSANPMRTIRPSMRLIF